MPALVHCSTSDELKWPHCWPLLVNNCNKPKRCFQGVSRCHQTAWNLLSVLPSEGILNAELKDAAAV